MFYYLAQFCASVKATAAPALTPSPSPRGRGEPDFPVALVGDGPGGEDFARLLRLRRYAILERMRYADIAQRRLFQQRLAQPDVATPGEVVRWFGAVQAQEYASSLYGVGLRMPNATERIVEQAIAAKTIVRTWPMRGTIHFTPPEDTRWMLKLMARRTNLKAASIYRRAGLSEDLFARAGDALTRALQGGKTLSRKQLYAALAAAGIATDGASARPASAGVLGA